MTILISTVVYALAKELGHESAIEEVKAQLVAPDRNSLECVRTITRLRRMGEDTKLIIDPGGLIDQCRSRHFDAFVKSDECDVWVSVDDDIEVSTDALATALKAVRQTDTLEGPDGQTLESVRPAVAIIPFWHRGKAQRVNTQIDEGAHEQVTELPGGGRIIPALAGGFGCVVVNKAAAFELEAEYRRSLLWHDENEEEIAERTAIFFPLFEVQPAAGARWYSEDLSFFKRAQAVGTIDIWAVVTGHTNHAGRPLDLGWLLQNANAVVQPCMRSLGCVREPGHPGECSKW